MSRLVLAREHIEILGGDAVEVHPRDRFPIIVVQQNRAIGLRIADDHAFRVDQPRGDRLDDVEAGNLLLRGDDAGKLESTSAAAI